MEIEVGEYVRTDKGYITKMSSEEFIKIMLEDKSVFGKALKHSKNIIDLVEEGDYVNGQEVIEVREQDGKIYLMTGYVPQTYIKEDVKSIVTHEQFESIEYKVKEDK